MPEHGMTPVSDLIAQGLLQIEDGNHGEYRPRRSDFVDSGTAFIRAADMAVAGIDFDRAEKINETARTRIRKGIGMPLDVILSHKGTVGKVALAPLDAPVYVCSPQTTFWRSLYNTKISPRFLYYALISKEFQEQLRALQSESDMAPYVSLTQQRKLLLPLPGIKSQEAISAVLGAIDDKIAVNDRIAETARALARAHFHVARESADPDDIGLASIVVFLNRGVAPGYTEDQSQLRVLNQKCVRDGRVNLAPSRWTLTDKVPNGKVLRPHDVLVNSTGIGTLGRVARWTGHEACTVDSHVTIVRFDPAKVDPVCAGFAMLDAEPEIESLGQGSTGQTELGRVQLSGLRITVPSRESSAKLRSILDALESRGDSALEESLSLAQLRDALLPRLMSGEIRVRDAEKVVEDVT